MVARASDNDTEAAILESWAVIANNKEFVTQQDMIMASIEPERIAYLVSVMPKLSDGYDYKAWTRIAYN